MIRKILFLVISPFNQRDFKRFGIELLEKNGFEVEVWDLTNFYFPQIIKTRASTNLINWSGLKVFENKNYVLNNLKNLRSDVLIISILPFNPKFYSIYKEISSSDARYASLCSNTYPTLKHDKNGRIGKLLFNLKKLQENPFQKLINYYYLKLPSSWLRLKPACLILAGGTESLRYQPLVDPSTEILWIHALDYDLYLEEKNKSFSEKSTAVFLDEYLPFHPDFFRRGVSPPIKPEKYYPLLNSFFMLIEQQLKLEVIIAAHPRSRYDSNSDFFEGRRWIKGQTIKLIKESKLVLAHTSTSLNFANLYHKPVIFLNCSELNKTYKGPLIWEVAGLFGKKPLYLDKKNNIDWNSEFRISKSHYENYRRAYIKTDQSEELPFWQIVANKLKTDKSL